jgi:hypothetical protein
MVPVGILQLINGTAGHEMAFTRKKLRSVSNPSLDTLLLEEGHQWGHPWDIYRYLPKEGKIINETSSDK